MGRVGDQDADGGITEVLIPDIDMIAICQDNLTGVGGYACATQIFEEIDGFSVDGI